MKTSTVLASSIALASSVLAGPTDLTTRASSNTPPVKVQGNAFYDSDGKRFYIRGLDYQPGGPSNPVDPIADISTCKRDIKYFKQLGLNTIRVYSVDNTKNHDECMSELSDAGIYLALDVNNAKYSINRADPGPSYNNVYLQSVFATIDAFAKYDNTLLYFSGNEVINNAQNSDCAPYIKAVTRDMKQYIGSQGYRSIPVGYSAADVSKNRFQTAEYMNCGSDDERSDFFSFNDYSYCPPSSYQQSGWSSKVQQYASYSIPLFLSEYGCNHVTPRSFQEVSALYNSEMTGVYSGGLVYEYSEESDNPHFGLVNINGNSISTKTDFNNLMKEMKSNPAPSGDGGAKKNGSPSKCPPKGPNWNVPNDALPAIPAPAKKHMTQGAGKGPGLTGDGSQNAGTQSSGTATPGSGAVTSSKSGSASSSAAAVSFRPGPFDVRPYICAAVVLVSSLAGASLM
ncbi:MAG: beta-glucanosyltransferase [Chrysothrix sp. TS-e1954]|nr:MAG: beta-glucanosyltransferase [Chrysothrix sp. TS-e1954]